MHGHFPTWFQRRCIAMGDRSTSASRNGRVQRRHITPVNVQESGLDCHKLSRWYYTCLAPAVHMGHVYSLNWLASPSKRRSLSNTVRPYAGGIVLKPFSQSSIPPEHPPAGPQRNQTRRLRLTDNPFPGAVELSWLEGLQPLPAWHGPDSPNWSNSFALCATMKDENITDVVEWITYYRCDPRPGPAPLHLCSTPTTPYPIPRARSPTAHHRTRSYPPSATGDDIPPGHRQAVTTLSPGSRHRSLLYPPLSFAQASRNFQIRTCRLACLCTMQGL